MRYWPLSAIAGSPEIPGHLQYELRGPQWLLSHNAVSAACYVAGHTPPALDCVTLVETVNGPVRRIFTDYPTDEEFKRFEPAGVMEDCYGNRCIMYDCFH